MKMRRTMLLLFATANLAALPMVARAQSLADAVDPSGFITNTGPQTNLVYTRPTQETKLRTYVFDAFGPYPLAGAAVVAGMGQIDNTPAAWQQGAAGYGRRFGSDFGIVAISTTTRYALAEALKEDTVYYRCECNGIFPRLRHAVVSTLTARHGEDGHRAFSFSAFIAPYAGTVTAVYAWYPDNYGAKSALRMGNYNLLGNLGENVLLEFLYGGPHSLLSRMHLNSPHAAPVAEPSR
jgi:hypothetical protein